MNPLLQPLAQVYRLGVVLRAGAYRRGWLQTRRLRQPVVSIGNLAAGGTGKTPLVALVAGLLSGKGWHPGILTRGYRRRSDTHVIALAPAAKRDPDSREMGDEPALLARMLPGVPIVIAADRYRGGLLAEERFNVDVHLLDDGFQHLALERDVDLVVLDVTREMSDRHLLPAGRLREPPSALRRAHLVVLNRCQLADARPVEEKVRTINPYAQIFHGYTRLMQFADVETGRLYSREELRGERVTAFCGIGNPGAFFDDLKKWNLQVTAEDSFRDHYVYSEPEVMRLISKCQEKGGGLLLTTDKDAANLPRDLKPALPIVACRIQAEIREGQEFERALLAALEGPTHRSNLVATAAREGHEP